LYTVLLSKGGFFGSSLGTEELAHLEMVGAMVKQLTENATIEEIKRADLGGYYSDHDKAIYPVSASGVPFTAAALQSKGDPIADLHEDMAAEQKARATYEYLMNLADDPDVIEPLKFLREREVVHFQRFGESLRIVQDYLSSQKQFPVKMPENIKAEHMQQRMADNMQPNMTEGVQGARMMPNSNVLDTRMQNMRPNEGMMGMQNMRPNEGTMGMQNMRPNEGTMGMQNMRPNEGTMGMQNMRPNEGTMGARTQPKPNEGMMDTRTSDPKPKGNVLDTKIRDMKMSDKRMRD